MNVYWVQEVFAKKYHNLKLTQKLRAGHTVYHSMHYVVLNGDIASALNNLTFATIADQSNVDQLMAATRQMTETENILGDQIKQITNTNVIPERQVQDEKNCLTKIKGTLQN